MLAASEGPNGMDGGVDITLLKQGPAPVKVGELMLHHHGFKGQGTVVGFYLEIDLRPASLETLLSKFFRSVAKLEWAVN